MKRAIRISIGLVIVLLCALVGVSGTQALLSVQDTGSGGRADRATRVAVASPEARRIEDAVTATGTIMPIRSVALVPDAPGRVTSVPVTSGQRVNEGDLLIQMDERAARAALADAEATLGEARQEFNRVERLAKNNTAAEAQLEGARANLLRAEAAVMTARADLQDRAITAPFDGTLGLIDIETGAYLDGSTPVTRLSDLSTVKVSATLPEQYFDRVQPGKTVTITTPAYPDRTFEGRVSVRAPEIDRDTRSFEIRADIDNPERRLAGGMFAHTRLLLGSYDGLAIPDRAIISEGLQSYVYTVSDGLATRTEIDAGKSFGDLTEVRGAMTAEARVVVAGWDRLSDGAAVTIAEGDAQGGDR
ncbi:efflux RND transporter periplasmic adaptor subunit [Roseovarius sp. D22-M7]|uniref:efflux RND transporter periplasmic adaptor subunit n=1 Tax=Roseovarius sp. D22-M7 TaxID=3127116 RepID=UPI00300FE2B7